MSARWAVGIDLGTTHCAMARVALDAEARTEVIDVPQLVAAGSVEAASLLPSFLYFPTEAEGPQPLPWDAERAFVVGAHARARAAEAPGRVVSSAKSWLCHPTLDRRTGILPLAAPDDVEKISPVEASWRLLEHLIEAYDNRYAATDGALAEQDVVLTVPASFDAAARELTVEAATAAGVESLTLLEEPQAALYAWLEATGDAWRQQLSVGDLVLVVDIGGGTTDFSAIAVQDDGGDLSLSRIAVGDHILLGGDNMDLALAHHVRQAVENEQVQLDAWQMAALVHGCRAAKERLLGDRDCQAVPVAVPRRGSKLVGKVLRTEVTREALAALVLDGFFPTVGADARPVVRPRAGLAQIGLPYASDAAVTRHLAAFLRRHGDGGMLAPTAVLFNGGVMHSELLRDRLQSTLGSWLPTPARALSGAELDVAVARGAASYGRTRAGHGVRIRGGTARAYYVGIEGAVPAVPGIEPPVVAMCVAPFGMEEGTRAELPSEPLAVVVGEPVRFRFFGSTTRRDDRSGAVHERWQGLGIDELAPIEIVLPADERAEGDVVPVTLRASITEVGTLLLEAVPLAPRHPDERWKVELSVRDTGEA